jgi:peptidoglycan/LPS O-acetylase OafA/YrhL
MAGRIRYQPALDGLRAFAVIGVLCYHGGLDWAQGGFLGVDLFFVLSGFLITTLLLREREDTGGIALGAFWLRRARRLLPALFLLLVLVVTYAVVFAAPPELRTIRGDALASLGYVANWRFIFTDGSYFAQFQAPSPLRHVWSLAIEEQFYLIWPLIVFGVLSLTRRKPSADGEPISWKADEPANDPALATHSLRVLASVTGIMLAVSVGLMALMYEPGRDPSRVYYGTDTRAQSLLVGALLAMLLLRRPQVTGRTAQRALQVGALVAAGGLAAMWTLIGDRADLLYTGGFLVEALLVAVVIAAVVQPERGPLAAFLSIGWLRWVGRVSYGVYLYHWPVYVALDEERLGLDGYALFTVRIVVTFVIAALSYSLLEMPIREGRLPKHRVRILAPSAAVAVLAGVFLATAGAPPAKIEVSAADVRAPTVRQATADEARLSGIELRTRVMLVGDSIAGSLAPGVGRRAPTDDFFFFDATVAGCGLTSDRGERWVGDWELPNDRCLPEWRVRWPQHIAEFDPDIVLLLLSAHDAVDRRIDGQEVAFDSPQGEELMRKDLRDAIDVLTARGARVIVLNAPYNRQPWRLPVDPRRSSFNNSWVDRQNSVAFEVASEDADRATLLDLNHFLDPDGRWTDTVEGVHVRAADTVHLSDAGADLVASWALPPALALAEHDKRVGLDERPARRLG